MKNSDYEGRQDKIRGWKTPGIETFENIYSDKDYCITMTIPEFTCLCPKTGLPDFGKIIVKYTPDKKCLELKSLKENLLAYRNKGIFHENVVNKIMEDIIKAAAPRNIHIEGVFNTRGGIQTSVSREYYKTG